MNVNCSELFRTLFNNFSLDLLYWCTKAHNYMMSECISTSEASSMYWFGMFINCFVLSSPLHFASSIQCHNKGRKYFPVNICQCRSALTKFCMYKL